MKCQDSYGLGPTVTDGAVASSLEDLFERLTLEEWKWDSIYSYCRENMGTLVGVLEQSWVVLKGNLGLLLNVLLEMVKLLLLSGSGVVNFALSVIVYLTALFYLLAASGRVYKPAEIMAKHGKVRAYNFSFKLGSTAWHNFIVNS